MHEDTIGSRRVDAETMLIVSRAQRGDEEAFGALAQSQADRLFAIARRILRDSGLAEDALQEALLTAWQELPRLRDPACFVSWITRTLVNQCLGEARRRARRPANVVELPIDLRSSTDEVRQLIDRSALDAAFGRLSLEHRSVLVLRHYVGLEPGEIAATLGLPAGTIRSRLHYAHRAMRAAVEASERWTAAS